MIATNIMKFQYVVFLCLAFTTNPVIGSSGTYEQSRTLTGEEGQPVNFTITAIRKDLKFLLTKPDGVSAFFNPSPLGWQGTNLDFTECSGSKTATFSYYYTGDETSDSFFPALIGGTMSNCGGTGTGTDGNIPFSYEMEGLITLDYYTDPATIAIAVGEEVTLKAFETGTSYGMKVGWFEMDNDPGDSSINPTIGIETIFSANKPGIYTVRAKRAYDIRDNTVPKTITINVIGVEVSVPVDTVMGFESGDFEVSIVPDTVPVDSIEWVWEVPEGSGSTASVPFVNGDEETTTVKPAIWYSKGDNEYITAGESSAPYTINCKVSINGIKFEDLTAPKWNVTYPNATPNNPNAYFAETPRAGFVGIDSIEFHAVQVGDATIFKVLARGDFDRSSPTENDIIMYIGDDNLFYDKIRKHELVHVDQWNNIAPWKDLYDADAVWDEIKDMESNPGKTFPEFKTRVRAVIFGHMFTDDIIERNTRNTREVEAHKVSNDEDPAYLKDTRGDE